MEVKAEKITPYDDPDRDKTAQVEQMFDSISPAYDFMNRAMTMGIDKLWRRKAVKTVADGHPRRVADLATGTGDLAIAMAKAMPSVTIDGYDLSGGMLEVGRGKVERQGLGDRISMTQADCLAMPAADNSYDAVTIAYGVRNYARLLDGYREMLRVLRPGGRVCVLELSTPRGHLTGPLYRLYTTRIIPAIGRMVSKDTRAYSYLPESIAAVPQGSDMCRLMSEAGFTDCAYHPMTFGSCTLYTASKPPIIIT